MKKILQQPKQCKNCPWRVDSDKSKIPNYCATKHEGLEGTIGVPSDLSKINDDIQVMACHNSSEGNEFPCIGWFWNQIGVGNNIQARLYAMRIKNMDEVEVFGEQYETFEETK